MTEHIYKHGRDTKEAGAVVVLDSSQGFTDIKVLGRENDRCTVRHCGAEA